MSRWVLERAANQAREDVYYIARRLCRTKLDSVIYNNCPKSYAYGIAKQRGELANAQLRLEHILHSIKREKALRIVQEAFGKE